MEIKRILLAYCQQHAGGTFIEDSNINDHHAEISVEKLMDFITKTQRYSFRLRHLGDDIYMVHPQRPIDIMVLFQIEDGAVIGLAKEPNDRFINRLI